MMLDPRRGTPRVNNFALEAGNYVLIRTEKRGEDPPWERLYLNENEGRLYFKPGASDPKDAKPRPYKDETYLVLAINKNTGEKDLDLDENTFGALLESLKNEDRARAQEQALVFNALQEALVERVQTADFGKAKRLLLDVRDAPSDGAARIALGRALDIVARCPAPGAARPKATKATDVALTDDQCDYLLRALSGTGNPDDIKAAVRDRARLTDVLIRSIRDQLKGTL
jgi:hypothetical protein